MRRTLSVGAAMLAAGLVAVAPAGAQGKHGRASVRIPPGQRPPAGLCRIWIDGVPPGRQPGVTDCAYAYSHVPPNGRVIYGGRATQRSYVQNRQYAPYYYGAPRQGDPNGNYIQRTRDRLNAARVQQLRSQELRAQQTRVEQSRLQQSRLQQLGGQRNVYRVRGDQYVPAPRAGDDERNGKKWKHEKEHSHGNGHGHGKHHD